MLAASHVLQDAYDVIGVVGLFDLSVRTFAVKVCPCLGVEEEVNRHHYSMAIWRLDGLLPRPKVLGYPFIGGDVEAVTAPVGSDIAIPRSAHRSGLPNVGYLPLPNGISSRTNHPDRQQLTVNNFGDFIWSHNVQVVGRSRMLPYSARAAPPMIPY